jgi:hypothetical protein
MKQESRQTTFCRKIKITDLQEKKTNQGRTEDWMIAMKTMNSKRIEIGN